MRLPPVRLGIGQVAAQAVSGLGFRNSDTCNKRCPITRLLPRASIETIAAEEPRDRCFTETANVDAIGLLHSPVAQTLLELGEQRI